MDESASGFGELLHSRLGGSGGWTMQIESEFANRDLATSAKDTGVFWGVYVATAPHDLGLDSNAGVSALVLPSELAHSPSKHSIDL
jgi:hypothetical protein